MMNEEVSIPFSFHFDYHVGEMKRQLLSNG